MDSTFENDVVGANYSSQITWYYAVLVVNSNAVVNVDMKDFQKNFDVHTS